MDDSDRTALDLTDYEISDPSIDLIGFYPSCSMVSVIHIKSTDDAHEDHLNIVDHRLTDDSPPWRPGENSRKGAVLCVASRSPLPVREGYTATCAVSNKPKSKPATACRSRSSIMKPCKWSTKEWTARRERGTDLHHRHQQTV